MSMSIVDMSNFLGNMQLRLHFRNAALGNPQKINKLPVSAPGESLCNIGANAHSSSLNLISQAEVFGESPLPRHGINHNRQPLGLLPDFYLFEPLYRRHFSTSQPLNL